MFHVDIGLCNTRYTAKVLNQEIKLVYNYYNTKYLIIVLYIHYI